MAPQVLFHFAAGLIGLVSGATALVARKGGRLHRRAGAVFATAMLTTAGSGAAMAFWQGQINNAVAGVLTVYLVATAWTAARRRDGETGVFEVGAFLFAAGMALIAFYFAVHAARSGSAMLGGVPYFIFAAIVSLAALLDLNALLRNGPSGSRRIARHLWRMHLGFAAAVGSFFPGQIDFFPEPVGRVRPIILLFIPPLAVVGLMVFWLIRIRREAARRPAA